MAIPVPAGGVVIGPCCCNNSFQVERLIASKKWAGLHPYWYMTSYAGESPPSISTDHYAPSVGFRINWRSRGSMSVHWDTTGASYDGFHTFVGAGNKPVITGIPDTICYQTNPCLDLNLSTALMTDGWGLYASIVGSFFVVCAGARYYVTSPGGGGWTTYSTTIPPGCATQNIAYGIVNYIPFFSTLAIPVAFINSISFPDFTGSPLQDTDFLFSEYDAIPEPGGGFTGGPVDADGYWHDSPNPYWNANPFAANTDKLWTGWFYYPDWWEEVAPGGILAAGSGGIFERVFVQRARWRAEVSTPYFICSARIVRPQNWGLSPSADDISDVTLVGTGVAAPGDIVEIPWIPAFLDTDFAGITMPVRGHASLSVGSIMFCNLGETTAEFTARTGIPIA